MGPGAITNEEFRRRTEHIPKDIGYSIARNKDIVNLLLRLGSSYTEIDAFPDGLEISMKEPKTTKASFLLSFGRK